MTHVLHCPYCPGIESVRQGTTPAGKPRYRYWECLLRRGRTLLLDDTYVSQLPEVTPPLVARAH